MAVWDALVLTALGGAIGTGGTWFGARIQAREAARVRSEQYVREDRFRLHKERVEAYSAFWVAAGNLRGHLDANARGIRVPGGGLQQRELRNLLWDTYTRVALVGAKPVLDAASNILGYADRVISAGHPFDRDKFADLTGQLRRAGRADLAGIDGAERPDEP
jgi:hypothetical protein